MTGINKGIINSGTIGGNASVTVLEVRERAKRTVRSLEDRQAQTAPAELAAVTAALVQLSKQAAEAAESRTAESQQLLAAIEALGRDPAAGKGGGPATTGLYARLVDAASKLADVAPAAVKLATQIGALIAL